MKRLVLLFACIAQTTLPKAVPGQGSQLERGLRIAEFGVGNAVKQIPTGERLVQVHQDFSKDPGWEWKNNRIVAEDPPIIKQDFGWSPSDHLGAGTGEIGGTVWLSRTPAWYALP